MSMRGGNGAKGLTKWEVGNELVRAADCLSEVASELGDYPELQIFVRNLRKELSERFTKDGFIEEMGFGI